MVYQHWTGTLTGDADGDEEEPAPQPIDLWLPSAAPVCASRFELDRWQEACLARLGAAGRFAGTMEYWLGQEEENDEEPGVP